MKKSLYNVALGITIVLIGIGIFTCGIAAHEFYHYFFQLKDQTTVVEICILNIPFEFDGAFGYNRWIDSKTELVTSEVGPTIVEIIMFLFLTSCVGYVVLYIDKGYLNKYGENE